MLLTRHKAVKGFPSRTFNTQVDGVKDLSLWLYERGKVTYPHPWVWECCAENWVMMADLSQLLDLDPDKRDPQMRIVSCFILQTALCLDRNHTNIAATARNAFQRKQQAYTGRIVR